MEYEVWVSGPERHIRFIIARDAPPTLRQNEDGKYAYYFGDAWVNAGSIIAIIPSKQVRH
jgi:hypothetical protein